jgi:hypothetical protein
LTIWLFKRCSNLYFKTSRSSILSFMNTETTSLLNTMLEYRYMYITIHVKHRIKTVIW